MLTGQVKIIEHIAMVEENAMVPPSVTPREREKECVGGRHKNQKARYANENEA